MPSTHTCPDHFTPVPLEKCYRLMNHGPTVLVSARHGGVDGVMAAAWACVLDFGEAPKVTVVLDKATRTRELIEASGRFALQLPCVAQAGLTLAVGTHSAKDTPDKLARLQVPTFTAPGYDLPLVQGCVGWLVCRLLPEPHNPHVPTMQPFCPSGHVTHAAHPCTSPAHEHRR